MKRYLIYILLIINSICYGQIYYSTSNRMYGTMSTPTYDNYRNINGGSNIGYSRPNIGYSTSRYGITNTYNMYERQYNNVYGGTYNPGNNRSGQPRKVQGVNSNGETIGNGNKGNDSDFWEDGYEYWWDSANNCWWRRSINSGSWERYRTLLGWGLFGWDWHQNDGSPSNSMSQGWQNVNSIPHPDDPYAEPLGEFPIGLLLILSFLFVYYKKFKIKTN